MLTSPELYENGGYLEKWSPYTNTLLQHKTPALPPVLTVVKVWSSLQNGFGSAFNFWFLTEEEAKADNELQGWESPCVEMVETFYGSNIHKEAVKGYGN